MLLLLLENDNNLYENDLSRFTPNGMARRRLLLDSQKISVLGRIINSYLEILKDTMFFFFRLKHGLENSNAQNYWSVPFFV